MRRMFGVAAALAVALAAAPAMAIVVADEILTGGPISLDNANGTTALGTLVPFSGESRFQQRPDLINPPGGINEPEENRLFKHDYTFTVPALGLVDGQANVNDLPNNLEFVVGTPIIDIRQLTIGLFTDGGPGSGGTLVEPPGLDQVFNPGTNVSLSFANLAPGDYTLRVAGILSGFDENGDWHGEYQGNIAITPLPGGLAMFLPAIVGLGLMGWRRLSSPQPA